MIRPTNTVQGIAVLNNTLYVGERYFVPYAQYWNGTSWTSVDGLSSTVNGLILWNNTLYASTGTGIFKLNASTNTFSQVVNVGQSDAFGFIASDDALYMIQDNAHVQRCTGTGNTMACTDLGDAGVGGLDTWGSDIVIAPELTLSA